MGAVAGAPALEEEAYWALVQESRNEIAQLKDSSPEEISLEMEELARQWDAVTEVMVDGKIVPVDHRYLTDLIRASPPDLEKLDQTLASIIDARQSAPIGVFSSADLDPLKEILARPEFQWAEAAPNPISEWINKVLDAFNRWLNAILDLTVDVAGLDLTAWIMAAILIVILFFVFRTLFADFMNEAQLAGETDEEPLTSESAFAKAQQLSRGGDYRAAVRYLYLSTLLILDERGVMRYDRSKTNREYLRSVANSPELSKPLEEVIDVFDNVWYGYHSLGEESFKHYSDRVEELKEKKA